jgi:hypothetical protein
MKNASDEVMQIAAKFFGIMIFAYIVVYGLLFAMLFGGIYFLIKMF